MFEVLSVATILVAVVGGSLAVYLSYALQADSSFARRADQIALKLFGDHLKSVASQRRRRDMNVQSADLSLASLAKIEKDLKNLRSVYVVANQIDEPKSELAPAVIDNFGEGVRYNFFVASDAVTRQQLDEYFAWYEHLYEAAKISARNGNGPRNILDTSSVRDVLSIRVIRGGWLNPPYVFYSYINGKGSLETLALRGSRLGSGISPHYEIISPEDAQTIIDICTRHAPEFSEALPIESVPSREEVTSTVVALARRA